MSISNISAVTNSQGSIAAAMEEVTETAEETRIEAARGDRQAIRKLAKQQQQQQEMQPQNPTRTPEPGVGEAIDHQG